MPVDDCTVEKFMEEGKSIGASENDERTGIDHGH